MKSKIKLYFESLNPRKLGLKKKIIVKTVKKLGMGTSNANFLVNAGGSKFVFRLNMHPKNREKIMEEFESLRLIDGKGIGPKPWVLDTSRKIFDSEFMIINYTDGEDAKKVKPYKGEIGLKRLAKLLSKIHSVKISGKLKKLHWEKENLDYQEMIKHLKTFYIDYIVKHSKNKLLKKMISGTYNKVKKNIPENIGYDLILTQGDFCEQNIIINGSKYSLIDFESLGLSNRFAEIAFVFTTFKERPFNKKQRAVFLNEYKRISKISEEDFDEKVQAWVPAVQFLILLWSIKHILRSKNNYFHAHFLDSNNLDHDIKYSQIVLGSSIKSGLVDREYNNVDLRRILK